MSMPVAARKKKLDACPLCGKPATSTHAPFCSQGCRDRDLLNWLGDGYRIAGPPAEEGLDRDPEGSL
jgi:endogenous inhibitor of DNA gyrase (YacG/DUF329 family)